MTSPTPEEKLASCPFCGGEAEVIHIADGENAGGSCVSCTRCNASSNVEFGFKENFISNWNRRSPSRRSVLEEAARVARNHAEKRAQLARQFEGNRPLYSEQMTARTAALCIAGDILALAEEEK